MKTEVLFDTYIGTQFPCAIENGDFTGLDDDEDLDLHRWLEAIDTTAKGYSPNAYAYFEYGEESEFEECDVTGMRGNCVAVRVTVLY